MNFNPIFTLPAVEDNADWQDGSLPSFVTPMLRNVHLSYDEETHTLNQTGDFWYWKLTQYGLDLMRLLVRTSANGFSYSETFTEPELDRIAQLVMLLQLNKKIHDAMIHASSDAQWHVLLDSSPYLQAENVTIDVDLFQLEIDTFIDRIQQGIYSDAGSKVFLHWPNPSNG